MSSDRLYSVRMRAAQGGAHEAGGLHISGGERLSSAAEINALAGELLHKALHHSRGNADFINLVIEQVEPADCRTFAPLSVSTYEVDDYEAGRQQAMTLLRQASVSAQAIERGWHCCVMYIICVVPCCWIVKAANGLTNAEPGECGYHVWIGTGKSSVSGSRHILPSPQRALPRRLRWPRRWHGRRERERSCAGPMIRNMLQATLPVRHSDIAVLRT